MTRIIVIILMAGAPLFASDTIILRDGSTRSGSYMGGTGGSITLIENGVQHNYDVSQVQSLRFDTASRQSGRTAYYGDRTAAGAPMLPAGTQISIRANEEISAKSANLGRRYPATIDRDVIGTNGQVIIPKGTRAQLVVRDVTTDRGAKALGLGLQS